MPKNNDMTSGNTGLALLWSQAVGGMVTVIKKRRRLILVGSGREVFLSTLQC